MKTLYKTNMFKENCPVISLNVSIKVVLIQVNALNNQLRNSLCLQLQKNSIEY